MEDGWREKQRGLKRDRNKMKSRTNKQRSPADPALTASVSMTMSGREAKLVFNVQHSQHDVYLHRQTWIQSGLFTVCAERHPTHLSSFVFKYIIFLIHLIKCSQWQKCDLQAYIKVQCADSRVLYRQNNVLCFVLICVYSPETKTRFVTSDWPFISTEGTRPLWVRHVTPSCLCGSPGLTNQNWI